MKTNRSVLLAIVSVAAIFVLVGFVTVHNHAPFTGADYAALLGALVFFALFVLLLIDAGSGLEMRLPRHLARLGHGFGLFDALRTMLKQMDEVRQKVGSGTLNEVEGSDEESKLFATFSSYFSDRRWKQVNRLKVEGDLPGAQQIAQKIRQDHNL